MNFIVDDIGINYKSHLHKLDKIKRQNPSFKMTAFVIAKGLDNELINWLKQDWIEVGIHCYDHSAPPEGECEDFEERTQKAISILSPLMNKKIYRFAGFQILASCYPILYKLGIEVIVHQNRIQLLKQKMSFNVPLLNTHIYENFQNIPIRENFQFISETI